MPLRGAHEFLSPHIAMGSDVLQFKAFDNSPGEEQVMSVNTISPKQLYDLVRAGTTVELVDVRTPVEYREVHVSFARNVPLDQLDVATIAAGSKGAQQPLYVICRSGNRGKQACEKFLKMGHPNVVNVEGGTQAWAQAGLPVVRGKQFMSLERQVRIAAGTLVLTGAALAAFVHPYWIALAAFVGAGLVFSGLSDTCGMGMLLARMPWNRTGELNNACGARHVAGH
jgi:rhodanese-related sulfurtransferase